MSGPIVVGIKDGELRVWRRDGAGNWQEQIGTDVAELIAALAPLSSAQSGTRRATTETDAGPPCDVVIICRGTPKLPPPDPAVQGIMDKVGQLSDEMCIKMEGAIE
jgi:hypothetical protein